MRRFTLLPQEHSVMVRQTSTWGQILLLSLVGLGATAIGTAWLYRLDEVITVKGRLVPSQGAVQLKSPLSGQLKEVMVENGEIVAKGQQLIKFDVEQAKTEEVTIKQQLQLEKIRIEDQMTAITKRQETLLRNIRLTEKILAKLEPLQISGAISEIQLLEQQNRLEIQKDEMIQLKTQEDQLINESRSRKADLEGRLEKIQANLRNEFIYSPIEGTVFDIKPDTDNYVATNAEPLVKIVPTGNLAGKVNVSNKDIGFISRGQEVKVRVDSFPYTEYGEINGVIESLGADALPPTQLISEYHFPVTLDLEKSSLKTREGNTINLQAGMTITTNLKLRDRRLIELVSDLFSNRSESLKRLRQP